MSFCRRQWVINLREPVKERINDNIEREEEKAHAGFEPVPLAWRARALSITLLGQKIGRYASEILYFEWRKRSRLLSGTSAAIYSWWSSIYKNPRIFCYLTESHGSISICGKKLNLIASGFYSDNEKLQPAEKSISGLFGSKLGQFFGPSGLNLTKNVRSDGSSPS